ncbi:TPA: hypothetical protein ACGO21_000471 [Streptococcus suis]
MQEEKKKRKGYATQAQQREATKRWLSDDKNRKHRNYLSYRGTARSFIKKHATREDLEELRNLISEREKNI